MHILVLSTTSDDFAGLSCVGAAGAGSGFAPMGLPSLRCQERSGCNHQAEITRYAPLASPTG